MAGQTQLPNMDQFEAYFRRADLDGDGRISGAEAVFFSSRGQFAQTSSCSGALSFQPLILFFFLNFQFACFAFQMIVLRASSRQLES